MEQQYIYSDKYQEYVYFILGDCGLEMKLTLDSAKAFDLRWLFGVKYIFKRYAEYKYEVGFRFKNFLDLKTNVGIEQGKIF